MSETATAVSSTATAAEKRQYICVNPQCSEKGEAQADFMFETRGGIAHYCTACGEIAQPADSIRTSEVDQLLASNGVTREQVETVEEIGQFASQIENESLSPLDPPAKDPAGIIAPSPTSPQTSLVPDSAANGLIVPALFETLVNRYSRELTKEDVRLAVDAFRTELAALDGRYDAELTAIEAKGADNWTSDDFKRGGEIRRFHKDIRVRVERTRKAAKNRALRIGQLIDGEANTLKEFAESRELRAEQIEKLEQIRASEQRAALAEARRLELIPFVDSVMPFDLGSMSDEQYQILLTGSKAAHEVRKAEIRRREQAALALERENIAAREKAEKRLARVNHLSMMGLVRDALLRVYEFKNNDLPITVADETVDTMSDAEWIEMMGRIEGDVNAIKARQEQAQKEAEEEALAERERLAALEREKAEREAQERATAEAQAKAEREAALAPDREKVEAYFKGVYMAAMAMPEVADETLAANLQAYFNNVADLTNGAAMLCNVKGDGQ